MESPICSLSSLSLTCPSLLRSLPRQSYTFVTAIIVVSLALLCVSFKLTTLSLALTLKLMPKVLAGPSYDLLVV